MVSNGILESNDSFYRTGLPAAKYSLESLAATWETDKLDLDSLFEIHRTLAPDPFRIVADDILTIEQTMQKVIGSDHRVLSAVANHLFSVPGKRVRPVVVCLVSRALQAGLLDPSNSGAQSGGEFEHKGVTIKQRQLSEITEMMHTATLLHDDVIDESATRRGVSSVHSIFGNKLAILGGDFLLARASLLLARLRDCDATELISTALEHLVKGEVIQLNVSLEGYTSDDLESTLSTYMTKSFYKTASLIANSCKAAAILGGHGQVEQDIAYEYGKNIGLAFQVIDDVLDFEGTAENMGKPTLNDLRQGTTTAPVLFAANQFPEVREMMIRKYSQPGDIERTLECVEQSNGVEQSKQLAREYADAAVAAVLQLNSSPAQSGLVTMIDNILRRDR